MRHFSAAVLLLACVRLWVATNGDPQPTVVSPAVIQAAQAPVAGREAGEWIEALSAAFDPLPGHPQEPARRLYDRIAQELRRGDCEAAVAGFRLFLELYPESPLAGRADYWVGECEFRLGRYEQAITSFDQSLARSPFNPQLAAAAFLKKGASYAKLGEIGRSRSLLELVVVQFPDTQEATLARKTLALP